MKLTVLDRDSLEELYCECYAVVKKETDRLLPQGKTEKTVTKPADSVLYKSKTTEEL